MVKLSKTQRLVLQAIDDENALFDDAPNHHRIAVLCARSYSAADFAHAPLRKLLALNLVEVAGKDRINARTWRITDQGKAALKNT